MSARATAVPYWTGKNAGSITINATGPASVDVILKER